jgi:hypothetical protein
MVTGHPLCFLLVAFALKWPPNDLKVLLQWPSQKILDQSRASTMEKREHVVRESHAHCEGLVTVAWCTTRLALFCVCDECDITWDHPSDVDRVEGLYLKLKCPTSCYTYSEDDQVRKAGWAQFVLRYKDQEPL